MSRTLERRLSLFDLVCLVMGAIVGVGIFFSPSKVVAITGSGGLAIAAWGVGGVIAILGALTFAELGGLLPQTGGQYVVLRTAYGRFTAFLYCWSLLAVIQSGAIGIIALIAVQNVGTAVGVRFEDATAGVLAAGMIAALVGVNVLGVRQGAGVTNLTLVLKSTIIVFVAIVGLVCNPAPREAVPAAALGDGSAWLILPAIVPILFAIGGWQQGLYVAGEVSNPRRNLPLGIIVGVLGVVALYLGLNIGAVKLLGVDSLASSKSPAADMVASVWPGHAARFVAAAITVSAVGVMNVCILTAPRMYKTMADDGCFFAGMGKVSERFGTPARALILQGSVAVALVLIGGLHGIDWLMTGVVCIDSVFFVLTGAALFVLRRKLPHADRPFSVPWYPVIPALFVLAEVGAFVAAFLDPRTRRASLVAVGVLVSGALVFLVFRRRRA